MKIIFFLIGFILVVTEAAKQCEPGYKCTPKDDCPHYWAEQEKLKKLQRGPEKKKIVDGLKALVCTQKPLTLCCAEAESPSFIPNPGNSKCGKEGGNAENIVCPTDNCDTKLGEQPWTALLGSYNEVTQEIEFTCGGTLINNWYVLSAAHCANKTHVRLGEWNIVDPDVYDKETCTYYNDVSEKNCENASKFEENYTSGCSKFNCKKGDPNRDCVIQKETGKPKCGAPHQDIEILQEIVHPDYYTSKINTLVNDIMLFKLAKPAAALNIYVQPICLDLDNSLDMLGEPGHDDIKTATVVGWGNTYNETADKDFFIAPTPKQQKLEMPIIDHKECVRKWKNIGIRDFSEYVDVKTHLCTGLKKGGSCEGDSGGPLIVKANKFKPYMLAGVVSFGAGSGKCDKGIPGVYTRVSNYIQWIKENLK